MTAVASVGTDLGAGVTAIGGLCVLIGFAIAFGGRLVRHGGVRTKGTIVGYGHHRRGWAVSGPSLDTGADVTSGLPSAIECPIVEFTTLNGQPIRGLARNGSRPRPGKVGARISVVYRARRPEQFWAGTGTSGATGGCIAIAFLAVGLLGVIAGVSLLG